MTLKPCMCCATLRAAAARIAGQRCHLVGRRAHGVNTTSPWATAATTSVVELQAASVHAGGDEFREAGLVDGHATGIGMSILR